MLGRLAMLRALPNMTVIRPGDAVETAEAWEIALSSTSTPTVLALSRQGLPAFRTEHKMKNQTALGAYVVAEAGAKRQAILIATGSEVHLALEARYRRKILPPGPVRVGIEAAVDFGWDRWLTGERGKPGKAAFVGMEGFGASAPAEELYPHFGITADAVADRTRELLGV